MASTERFADERIQRYLGTKEVVVLATLGPDGAPRVMAMWFLHTPDAILMLTVADLQKVRDLRRDPRALLELLTGSVPGQQILSATGGLHAHLYQMTTKTPTEEQLRVLEHGFRIGTVETTLDTIEVDTPEDLERARQLVEAGVRS